MRKKYILIILFVLIPTMLWINRLAILEIVLPKAMEARFSNDYIESLQDGLHLGLCGSGGPMPSSTRSGPCVVAIAGNKSFIFEIFHRFPNLSFNNTKKKDETPVLHPLISLFLLYYQEFRNSNM